VQETPISSEIPPSSIAIDAEIFDSISHLLLSNISILCFSAEVYLISVVLVQGRFI